MADEELTPAEAEALKSILGTAPVPEEKKSVHAFLFNVASSSDTTKLGNLTEEEVGIPKLPLRTYLDLALFCKEIANMTYFSNYFKSKAEILTSTSLSKDAKLIELAVVTKKEVSNIIKTKKTNKGWFKPKRTQPEGGI